MGMSSGTDGQDSVDELAEKWKREYWQQLLHLENEGALPEGETVVSLHDRYCAEIDAEVAASKQHMKAADQRKDAVIAQMRDLAIDLHIQDQHGEPKE